MLLTKDQLADRLRGMSIKELERIAGVAGVSAKTLLRIRSGADYQPRLDAAERISGALAASDRERPDGAVATSAAAGAPAVTAAASEPAGVEVRNAA